MWNNNKKHIDKLNGLKLMWFIYVMYHAVLLFLFIFSEFYPKL